MAEYSLRTFARSDLDQIIKAYDVRGVVATEANSGSNTVTPELVFNIGVAFGLLMRDEGATSVVIGHDMRESSPVLSRAFAEGATRVGLNATLLGLTATDQLYWASGTFDCPGAMFTASHNPAQYNGIKMCRAGARPIGQETGLADIVSMLANGFPKLPDVPAGSIEQRDTLNDYAVFLHQLVNLKQARRLKVAVDAGNGMGGLTVPAVLGEVCDIADLYFELDGNFPNHEANPLEPENLRDLQKFVVEQNADIGIAFDGDADRCFVVDEKGHPVSPSAICALVASRYLEQNPGATIIHNLITSAVVPELIEQKGGKPVRTRVGHSFIKAKMAEEQAVFGGEHSAHYYFQEFWNADSGMLAALHVLAALAEQDLPLSEFMAQYDVYVQSGEINSRLANQEQQQQKQQEVLAAFESRAESSDWLDGLTVQLGNHAWFNVRASNTEPLLRLNVEAATAEEVAQLRDEILAIIRG